jgi:Icc-related predicted phosphoesterase
MYSEDRQQLENALSKLEGELKGIVEFQHTGDLRIFAFSDYRVHDIRLLLDILDRSSEPLDVVVYAGDDVERFAPPRFDLVNLEERGEFLLRKSSGKMLIIRKPSLRQADENFFEKIAKKAKAGLIAVSGNDNPLGPVHIYGEKVYDVYRTWVKIGRFLFIGLEGAAYQSRSSLHSESAYAVRLELAKKLLNEGEKLIIVSHVPPRGILDYAKRMGEENIGSKALRIFLEHNPNLTSLVICGHVHREGGKKETIGGTLVVNVASHDFVGYRGVVAIITVNNGGKARKVDFLNIPSPMEEVLKRQISAKEKVKELTRLGIDLETAKWLVDSFEKQGDNFLEEISKYPWRIREFRHAKGKKDTDLTRFLT